MLKLIVICIIALSGIAALFLAWFFYQQARDKERMVLIERGEKLEDIFLIQKQNKFEFVFPWLTLGVITIGMSIAFLAIAFFMRYVEKDAELFKGFSITFILGFFLGCSLLALHVIKKKEKARNA